MCGIALLLAPDSPEAEEEMLRFQTSISDWIGPRGEPQDCSDVGVVKVSRALNNRLWLGASVLHIQGGSPASQPRRDEQGNELLWNGEVFDFETATSCHISAGISDTILVSDSLCKIVYECNETPLETLIVKVTEFMSSIRGPYAFIYFIPSRRIVLYGRDPFGRRSLVRRLLSDCSGSSHLNLVLSSVAIPGFTFEEVPIEGIYVFNIVTNETLAFKWPLSRTRLSRKHRITSSDTAHPTFESSTGSSFRFLELVRQSISKRVNSLATASQVQCATASTVGALFSGGIDSVLLARVLHDVLPPCLSIDLINVSFYDPSSHSESPDRLAAIMAWNDLKVNIPIRNILFILPCFLDAIIMICNVLWHAGVLSASSMELSSCRRGCWGKNKIRRSNYELN
jgi:asparagine synthetase B (glutamine-hydrolysing)